MTGSAGQDEATSNNDFEIIEVADGRHYVSDWRAALPEAMRSGISPKATSSGVPSDPLKKQHPMSQRELAAIRHLIDARYRVRTCGKFAFSRGERKPAVTNTVTKRFARLGTVRGHRCLA
jgi:hypothetical protein